MDVDELRQSQRKAKKPTLPIIPLVTVSATSVSGSGQDSDEDDDEVTLLFPHVQQILVLLFLVFVPLSYLVRVLFCAISAAFVHSRPSLSGIAFPSFA